MDYSKLDVSGTLATYKDRKAHAVGGVGIGAIHPRKQSRILDSGPARGVTPVESAATDGPILRCQQRFPRLPAGAREMICTEARMYRDPGFNAWKVRLRFHDLLNEEHVFGFFHLSRGSKPVIGRRSRYYAAWVMANGGPPRRRDRLSPRVFKGKWFLLRIRDVRKRHDQLEHSEHDVYSNAEILKRVGP